MAEDWQFKRMNDEIDKKLSLKATNHQINRKYEID